jgi:hypothetical protein
MNMKKLFLYISVFMAALLAGSCSDSDEDFGNKVYINSTKMVSGTVLKGNAAQITKTIGVATSRPAEKDIEVTYKVDMSKVDVFNRSYGMTAVALPDTCYEMSDKGTTIQQGSVKSPTSNIVFKNLSGLDHNAVYVLPVTISTNDMAVLSSAQTYYYYFQYGTLINIVPDMEKNWFTVENWKNPSDLKGMKKVTIEALINIRDWVESGHMTSVFGVEGELLIRIGDVGWPTDQIQVATRGSSSQDFQSSGKSSGKYKACGTNQWVHLALTFDADTKDLVLYYNDEIYYSGHLYQSEVNFADAASGYKFQIGRAYEDGRYLNGYMSEVRIWNCLRTKDEIVNNYYYVDPNSPGLVGYWKLDDDSSLEIKDYSVNGNNAVANSTIKWHAVSLPEKQ